MRLTFDEEKGLHQKKQSVPIVRR